MFKRYKFQSHFIKTYLWIFFIYFLFKKYQCNVYYPENIKENDIIYQNEGSATYEQIYKAGYFSTEGSPIRSYKNGINYEVDETCGNSIEGNTIIDYLNNNPDITNERSIFKKYIESNNVVECTAPFPKILTDVYKLTYIIPIYVQNPEMNVSISFNGKKICWREFKGLEYYEIIITSRPSSTSNKRKMSFSCSNQITNEIEIEIEDDSIMVKFTKEPSTTPPDTHYFYISNYIVTIKQKTNQYYTTLNGATTCSNTNDAPNRCLPHYYCAGGGICKKCHSSCYTCSGPNKDQCILCNRLTYKLSNLNTCEINYLNLKNFDNFNIEIDAPKTHRVTVGFWIFLSNPKNEKLYIVFQDYFTIKLILTNNNLNAYCYAYPNLLLSNDDNSFYVKQNINDIKARWFHITCAMSFDEELFYINYVKEGSNQITLSQLKHMLLYLNSSLNIKDPIYRPISFEKKKIEFNDFKLSNGNVYLKYFTVFQEYFKPKLQYMYFDFQNVDNFPELLYVLPFDNFQYDIPYSTKDMKGKTINLVSAGDIDISPPLNFKNFHLPEPNKYYSSSDLSSEDIYVDDNDNSLYLYGDNKPLRCKKYLIWKDGNPECTDGISGSEHYCEVNDNKYKIYPGLNDDSGYCDKLCSLSHKCSNTIWTNQDSYCTDYENNYNMFYECTNNQYVFQFSRIYQSKDRTLEISLLESYIIDFWFYPDLVIEKLEKFKKNS